MLHLWNLNRIWLLLVVYPFFLGFQCIDTTFRKKESSTAIFPRFPTSHTTDSLPCETKSSVQFDRLPVWSSAELQRIEKRIADNIFKSAVEEGHVMLLYSKFLWINGNDTKSEGLLNELIGSVDKGPATPLLGWLNYNLGEIYYLRHYLKKQNTLNDAWSHHRKAKAIFQTTGDSTGLVKSLSRLGVLHERASDLDSANHYYNRSISVAKRINYAVGLSRPYTHLALASLSKGDTTKAHTLIEKALKINKECTNYEELSFSLVNTALLQHPDKSDLAKLKLLEAIKIAKKIGFKLAEIHALFHLGRIAQETGDLTLARNSCNETIALANGTGYSIYSEAAENLLATLPKE